MWFPKPNVLIIIATGIIGGPGKGLFQLLKHSSKLGFDYTLCNFHTTYMKSGNDEFCKRAADLNIRVNLIRQNSPIDPNVVIRANRIRINSHSNIVQTHGYKPNVIGFFLKRLSGIPWIAFAHGYTDDNRKVRAYNLFDLLALRYADTVVAVSKSMKKLLMQKGVKSSKICNIHNAVDKDDLIPSITENEAKRSLKIEYTQPVIGVVGRLGPEKGHIVFLKAFRYVLREFPHAKALIIGDGQEMGKLLSFSKKENMARSVVFTGHVKNISDYYQIMDLLVIPSFSEGLPNVLLEAMALGIPVMATSVGGIPEVLNRDNGVLVPPGNPTRLGEEIVSLLRDRTRMDMFRIMAQKSIAVSFEPNQRAHKIARIYSSLLHSRHDRLEAAQD